MDAMMTAGSAIWGLLFGRRRGSRATTAARRVSMAARDRLDIRRAEEQVEAIREKIDALEEEVEREIDKIEATWYPEELPLESIRLRPRKADITIEQFGVAWTPWWRSKPDKVRPAW